MARIIGIGECTVSNDDGETLITHALGSCIAVIVYDPVPKVAGMLHFMLPESSIDPAKAAERPFVYADTGVPKLFQAAYQLGAVKQRMHVMVTGGAQMLDPNGTFNIGQRNHQALRKIFWKAGVIVHKEMVGGHSSRTVSIAVGTGTVQLRTSGEAEQVIQIKPKDATSKIGA